MAAVREHLAEYGWRRIAFSLVVVVFLGLVAFLMRQLLVYPVAGWFENALGLFGDHKIAPHRVHDFAFSLIFWTGIVGMLAQLRSPAKNAGGLVMALLPWSALLVAFALTDFWQPLPFVAVFGGVTLLAALLHPSGLDLVDSFELARLNKALLVFVIIAAVPLLAYAATNVGLQTGAIEPAHGEHDHASGAASHEEIHQEHIDAGHFALIVAISLIVIGLGLIAAFQPDGWWVAAWMAGLVAVIIGLVSVVYPGAASSAELLWGVAAILWGVVFIAIAEYTQDPNVPTLLGARKHGSP